MSELVRNPEDRFSCHAAQIIADMILNFDKIDFTIDQNGQIPISVDHDKTVPPLTRLLF